MSTPAPTAAPAPANAATTASDAAFDAIIATVQTPKEDIDRAKAMVKKVANVTDIYRRHAEQVRQELDARGPNFLDSLELQLKVQGMAKERAVKESGLTDSEFYNHFMAEVVLGGMGKYTCSSSRLGLTKDEFVVYAGKTTSDGKSLLAITALYFG